MPPPLHAYVTPVAGVAVNVELVTAHVKLLLLVAVTTGGVVFDVTVTDAVLVQPFEVLVTVTV